MGVTEGRKKFYCFMTSLSYFSNKQLSSKLFSSTLIYLICISPSTCLVLFRLFEFLFSNSHLLSRPQLQKILKGIKSHLSFSDATEIYLCRLFQYHIYRMFPLCCFVSYKKPQYYFNCFLFYVNGILLKIEKEKSRSANIH